MTVLEKVTVTVAITVTVSLGDYKVAYGSFQASRRPTRKLVLIIIIGYLYSNEIEKLRPVFIVVKYKLRV